MKSRGHIRLIKKEDLSECRDIIYSDLDTACENKDRIRLKKHYSSVNLNRFLRETETFFVFLENKNVLATCRITKRNEICTVYVKPGYQKMGIGKQMVKKLEDRARKSGIKKVHVHAFVSAIGFYEKLGYSPCRNTSKRFNKMEKKL